MAMPFMASLIIDIFDPIIDDFLIQQHKNITA